MHAYKRNNRRPIRFHPLSEDRVTRKLLKNKVYSISSAHKNKMSDKNAEFSVYSSPKTDSPLKKIYQGSTIIFILTILLWWFPIFGQMIAGYLGGRRTVSGRHGIYASIFPIITFILFTLLLHIYGFPSDFETVAYGYIQGYFNDPVISPFVSAVYYYIAGYVNYFRNYLLIQPAGYFITIIFSYIGGMVSEQRIRESDLISKSKINMFIKPRIKIVKNRAESREQTADREQENKQENSMSVGMDGSLSVTNDKRHTSNDTSSSHSTTVDWRNDPLFSVFYTSIKEPSDDLRPKRRKEKTEFSINCENEKNVDENEPVDENETIDDIINERVLPDRPHHKKRTHRIITKTIKNYNHSNGKTMTIENAHPKMGNSMNEKDWDLL